MVDFRRLMDAVEGAQGLEPAGRDAFLARACAGDAALLAEARRLLAAPDAGPTPAPAVRPAMGEGALLAAALRAPPEERSALLDRLCAGSPELRALVELGLLAAPDEGMADDPSALAPTLASDAAAPGAAAETRAADDRPGTAVGRYELLEKLGEGGMGEVWVARQSEPVKRKVALKLIKRGMDSRAVVQRFEQERQALALMDHPHIAKVLDGGVTDAGQPFFVMELVAGKPLTAFCDDARLGIRERLELFVPICQAVQHAHQKGVIHRDLKPANILVTTVDGKPTPKVIDFGVAKAVSGKLTEETLSTQFGAVVGTLEYMAPEQAGLSVEDVDTRADVYALGVILYELLTGLRPFDPKRLRRAALDEVIRVIREEDPPSLASRLSTDVSLPSAAVARGVEPRRLVSLVKGELDWIVARCLEKDRNRRYESASALARDVERHLADEPVEARPAGGGYRLRKFLRKHRAPVAAASLLVGALLSGIAGTTWQAYRASLAEADAKAKEKLADERRLQVEAEQERTLAQKDRAEKSERSALADREQAVASGEQARREREIAVAVRRFLQQDLLGQGNPWERAKTGRRGGPGQGAVRVNPTIRELLDRAADRLTRRTLADEFRARPQVYTEIVDTVADAYQSLGEDDRAVELLKAALVFRSALTPLDETGDLVCRLRIAAASFRAQRMTEVAAQTAAALAAIERNVASAPPPGGAGVAGDRFQLGLRQLDAAIETAQQQFSDLPSAPVVELSLSPLLVFHLARAKGSVDKILAAVEARLGRDDRRAHLLRISTAFFVEGLGRRDDAHAMFEASLEGLEKAGDADGFWARLIRENLARLFHDKGEYAKAAAHTERVLGQEVARYGADHPTVACRRAELADYYRRGGRLTEALGLLEAALRSQKAQLGPDHPWTVETLFRMAWTHEALGKPQEAVAPGEQALAARAKTLGAEHPQMLNNLSDLARIYWKAGRRSDAVALFDQAAAGVEKQGFQYAHAGTLVLNAAKACEAVGHLEKAEAWRRKWLAVVKRRAGAESSAYADELAALGSNLIGQRKWAAAEGVLHECLRVREKNGPDDWRTFNAAALLGAALLGGKKYPEAERRLLNGYSGMKGRSAKIPPTGADNLPEALDRLVELYAATNRPDAAEKWRAERAKYPPAAASTQGAGK